MRKLEKIQEGSTNWREEKAVKTAVERGRGTYNTADA